MKAYKLIVLTFVFLAAGCQPRIKSLESNESAMTPNPKASGMTIDPYTYGGIATATGGTKPAASYASSQAGSTSAPQTPAKPAKKPKVTEVTAGAPIPTAQGMKEANMRDEQ